MLHIVYICSMPLHKCHMRENYLSVLHINKRQWSHQYTNRKMEGWLVSLFPLTRRCQTSLDTASKALISRAQKPIYRRTPLWSHLFNVLFSPECCVNILMPGSETLTAAVLPGGVPVILPGSRGLLPALLPRLPFPWCGWDAWGCGGWSPVDAPSPTRPTCCPIPVV